MPVFVYTLHASSAYVHLYIACLYTYEHSQHHSCIHAYIHEHIHEYMLSRAYMYTQYIMCTNIVAFIHIYIHTQQLLNTFAYILCTHYLVNVVQRRWCRVCHSICDIARATATATAFVLFRITHIAAYACIVCYAWNMQPLPVFRTETMYVCACAVISAHIFRRKKRVSNERQKRKIVFFFKQRLFSFSN
jgi:hypothetical protein